MASVKDGEDIRRRFHQILSSPIYTQQAQRFAFHYQGFAGSRQSVLAVDRAEQILSGTPGLQRSLLPPQLRDAGSLFTRNRFDLRAMYLFAAALISGQGIDAARDAYIRQLFVMNRVWQSQPMRTSPDQFVAASRSLIDSLRKGFDSRYPVVLSHDGSVFHGAHRVAVCHALRIPVVTQMSSHSPQGYTREWLQDRSYLAGDERFSEQVLPLLDEAGRLIP